MAIAELYGKQASAEDLQREMLSLELGDFAREAGLEFEVDVSIEVSAKRGAGEGISIDLDGFEDDDIVEITLENGLKFYTRVDELADEKSRTDMLMQENLELSNETKRYWFLSGALVLLFGMLLGFWIPRVRWQRRSGYDRF